ncbi:MAG: 6-bladed beta-propeller [Gemmatimonadaceae bacterium]
MGSLDGADDSFGRVMSATLDSRGRVLVADDRRHRIAVFGADGRFVQAIGRLGRGPGEFQSPWIVAVDASDSVFVWDTEQSRISVFDPGLTFRRSFRVPPQWLITTLKFLPTGDLLVAAYARGERFGIRILDREGNSVRAFGPVEASTELFGFESSLLGGTLDVTNDELIVYSRKSPYEILVYDLAGRLQSRCTGDRAMTTAPETVVDQQDRGVRLNWRRYVHSSGVVALGAGVFANTISDPVRDTRVVDLLNRNCQLLRRTRLNAPVSIVDRRGSRVVAVSNLEFPEVIVYSMRLNRR